MYRMQELNFRQVHLDFHTNSEIVGIGSAFDPKEFAQTLVDAKVNSITCFARCHHGMLYYDSKLNPERIHPHLVNKNLLKQQIEACHEVGIRVPIYTTVQWDYYTAKAHRDWVCMDTEGRAIGEPGQGPQGPLEPGFYETLCVNTPYRDFLKAHVKEILETFEGADGLFLDIVFPVECCCSTCMGKMLAQGLNPHNKEDRQLFGQQSIDNFKRDMTAFIRQFNKTCTIFYNRGHVGTPHRPVKEAYTHFELETLPSGAWGYLHFPATIRYARTLGKECLAQTGKFHTMWGDFHSFKNKAALEFECFNMLALNAKCMIGDQLEPKGSLSKPVYELIGSVYEQIEQKEAWCKGATPVTEIGVLTPEEFVGATVGVLPESLRGAIRMLQESSYQFDVLDTYSDFENYRLIILPDVIPVSPRLNEKLVKYTEKGGKVICTFESGLNEEKTQFALDNIGVTKREEQGKDLYGRLVAGQIYDRGNYCEYLIPKGDIGAGLPETEHVMYTRGLAVDAEPESEVLVDVIASVFDRDYRHFCSHRQSPSSGQKASDGIVINNLGNIIYFSHPIFTQYNYNAPRWCKVLLTNAINKLLGDKLLDHKGPTTMLAAINDQLSEKRRVVHLLHYIPERRSQAIDIIEDVIPLYQVDLKVQVPQEVARVVCEPQHTDIAFEQQEGSISFTVPKIEGHQMVVIYYQ